MEKQFSWEEYEVIKKSMESKDWFSLVLYYSEGMYDVESAVLDSDIDTSDVEVVFKIGHGNDKFLTKKARRFMTLMNESNTQSH